MATTKPLIAIVGETASGKSALGIELAKRFNGEIICADSWTVRREVNIGTAKPSADEQKAVPHHLLDVVDPCADFTAAVFKRLANKAIRDIHNRSKLPIMAGGTGLYIDSVLYDYQFLPEGDRGARAELEMLPNEALVSLIKEKGYSLENIDTRNKRRLIRVLEAAGERPGKSLLRQDTLILGLQLSREDLKSQVEKRTESMIENGLEAEVKLLAERYGWGCEALKGIGYKEWREYFSGVQSIDGTKALIIKNTLDLAKRQRTWFKRNNSIHWIDDPSNAVEIVTTFLNKY